MEIRRLIVGELNTNCYFLISKGELLIIDPGGEPERIVEEAKKTGAVLKYVVNTHNHSDHTLGNKKLEEAGAEILKGLKEGDSIRVGGTLLKVIGTPGHAKESICLLKNNLIFTGDTLFKDGYGRTDFPGGDEKEMEESLKRLSGVIKPGMAVYPGHGELFEVDNKTNKEEP